MIYSMVGESQSQGLLLGLIQLFFLDHFKQTFFCIKTYNVLVHLYILFIYFGWNYLAKA